MGIKLARRYLDSAARERVRTWVSGQPSEVEAFHPDHSRDLQIVPDEDGLNVVGYLHAELGVGESARSTIRAAQASGIKISAYDFRVGCSSRMQEVLPEGCTNEQQYSVNLCHVNADQVPLMHRTMGPVLLRGKIQYRYWVWELEDFPEEWVGAFKLFNEIWTPTRFTQETCLASRISRLFVSRTVFVRKSRNQLAEVP